MEPLTLRRISGSRESTKSSKGKVSTIMTKRSMNCVSEALKAFDEVHEEDFRSVQSIQTDFEVVKGVAWNSKESYIAARGLNRGPYATPLLQKKSQGANLTTRWRLFKEAVWRLCENKVATLPKVSLEGVAKRRL